ncbi:hypothetical protein VIA_003160 [Vibrio orientalis CIP 102891 = ATCC 33934]|uniref:Uncharacterized protein n=1 Tax=Vibrio orientalis CIP 102891 = ATCC 33934 TaxID=675816 RepID=A0ABM9YYL0_VIBOR|nr:hypothetical protein VIA_003160 [Vibrio orientalis CIP 102891 = ATCC 33934]
MASKNGVLADKMFPCGSNSMVANDCLSESTMKSFSVGFKSLEG